MNKVIFTYLSLLLILSSVFSFPLSAIADQVTEEEPTAEVMDEETVEEATVEETTEVEKIEEASEEPSVEEEVTEEVPQKKNAPDENVERHGFSLTIDRVFDQEGNAFTEEKPLDSTALFTLRMKSTLLADQNYTEGDIVAFNLPNSIEVAGNQTSILQQKGTDIAEYTVDTSGVIEFTFLSAVEEINALEVPLDVQVQLSDAALTDKEHTASIEPIGTENPISIPLQVEADEKGHSTEEKTSEEDSEEQAAEESNEEKSNEEKTSEEDAEDQPVEEEAAEAASSEEESTEKNASAKAEDEKQKAARVGDDKFILEIDNFLDTSENPISEENGNLPGMTDEFILDLKWELLDGHTYVGGDTVSFELPEAVKVIEEQSGTLDTQFGETVVNYTIREDGTVDFVFTDYVENNSSIKGHLYAYSMIDADNAEVEDGNVIVRPIGDEGTKRLPIEMDEKEKTIEKKGQPNRSYNADEIGWEVIINKDRMDLQNAMVVDTLPEGTKYKEGSVSVTQLDVNLNGEVIGEGETVELEDINSDNGKLTMALGDTDQAYRINYTTTVTDDDRLNFRNNAVLKDDMLDDVNANANVTIKRGDPVAKRVASGGEYNPVTGEIAWEVDFNFNQKNLEAITFTDQWKPEGTLEIVDDSLQFEEVTIDENGNVNPTGNVGLPEGAIFSKVTDGFEVSNITTDKAYRITYKTEVTERIMDSIKVKNTAQFGESSATSGTGIGQFVGSKRHVNTNYVDETMKWNITLNQDKYLMKNIVIEDSLSEGLSIQEESINVTVGGKSYTDYTFSDGEPFKITFPDGFETTEEVKVTYLTDYVSDEVLAGEGLGNFDAGNTAVFSWLDAENNSQTKTVQAGTNLNKETRNNHWKNGSYDPGTKEITWRIYTNYRQNTIDNLIINDAPQGNQKIVSDSVKVYELNVGSDGGNNRGTEVTGDVGITYNSDNTFTAAIGQTQKAYYIEYKTSVAGLSDIQGKYTNQAEIMDGDESLETLNAEVGVQGYKTYASKDGQQNGKQMDWQVQINVGQQMIKGLQLSDTVSENQELLRDSIQVYNANVSGGQAVKTDALDSSLYDLTISEDGRTLNISWKDKVERAYVVEYSSLFFAKNGDEVSNSYKVTGEGDFIEDANDDGSESRRISLRTGGGAEGTAGYLVIDKVDVTNGGDDKLAGAEFQLIDPETGRVLKTAVTDENGKIDFGRLLFGEYTLVESVIPEGYVTNDASRTITIDKAYTPDADLAEYAYTVENFVPVYAIDLVKTDDLGEPLPDVEFVLYDSEDNEVATGTTNNDGIIEFENLPEAGTYYLEEVSAPAGYEQSNSRQEVTIGDKESKPVTVEIVNQRELMEVSGQKIWEDNNNQDGLRPESVTIELKADGRKIDSVEVTADTDWKYSFKNLPTHEDGKEITYTIDEKPVSEYETEVNGFDVINSYTPEVTTVSGEKIWEDANNQDGNRPDAITINLLADGEEVASRVITEEDGWEYSFKDLPKYDSGNEIAYTVEEEAVEGYAIEIDGFDITNSYEPELTEISVSKVWEDEENQDGIRPDNVDVNLLTSTGDVVKQVELSADNDWQHTFTDLPKYSDGEEIDYRVTEDAVSDYSTKVEENQPGDYTITNTHTPDETSVTVTKGWDDGNNQDGNRPENITLQLMADGEPQGDAVVVSASENWTYTWSGLDQNASGSAIDYTVEELNVPEGYDVSVNDADHGNIIITNSYTPELIDIPVTKVWEDEDDQDGVRPDDVTVNVLNGNGEIVRQAVLKEKSDWTYTFTDLPKYNQGEIIEYSVTENTVSEYSTTIEGNAVAENGVTIINTHTPGETSVTVTKGWDDGNNQDGNRPTSIEVQLFADGEETGEPVSISAASNWSYTWDGLDERSAGTDIIYSVEEIGLTDEYEVDINDNDQGNIIITNSYTPELIDIPVIKVWEDKEDQDGVRPERITVNLLDGTGDIVRQSVISSSDEWEHTFTDLPKYAAGEEIQYRVIENAVEGYSTEISENDEGQYVITNSYTPEETSVTVTKGWKDDNNQEKTRPESIKVQLVSNGEHLGEPIELSASNDWTYTWNALDAFNAKEPINYSIEEIDVPEGYEASIDDANHGNIILTNVYTQAEEDEDASTEDNITEDNTSDGSGKGNQPSKESDEDGVSGVGTGSDDASGNPSDNQSSDQETGLLPDTGEAFNSMIIVIAVLLFVVGGGLIFFARRQR